MPALSSPRPRRLELPALAREFALYTAVSAVALAVDTTVFVLGLRLGLAMPYAAALGFALGLVLVYAASTLHIFRRHSLRDRRFEFIAFTLIGLLGLAATQALLWLTMERFGLNALPAKLLTAAGVFLLNFSLRRWLLFTTVRETELP